MLPDTIHIVTPPQYQHSETFRELAEGFKEGFAELGYVVPITTVLNSDRPLVLGAHLLPELPTNAIIYNTEQVGSFWFTPTYIELLRTHEVWDYSEENIDKEKRLLQIEAKYCPVGYEPVLTRIPQLPEEKQDIDVLFYGSPTPRRVPILKAIEDAGLKLQTLFGVYGAERDYYIARSKIVLNLHAYDDSPFEIVRVSYLWANRKCMVSEGARYYAPDGSRILSIEESCKALVNNLALRTFLADQAFHEFTKVRQSEYLKVLV